MARAEKVPVNEYEVRLTLTIKEAKKLKALLGKCSGAIEYSIFDSLLQIGIIHTPTRYKVNEYGTIKEDSNG